MPGVATGRAAYTGWLAARPSPPPERTDVRCACRARPRDPRWRAPADGERLVPCVRRRQDRPRRTQRCGQDHAHQGARRRRAALGWHRHPVRRTRLPAAGPAFGQSGRPRPYPDPRCPRPRPAQPRHDGGLARDGVRRPRGRCQGDEALRGAHREVRGAGWLRGRGRGSLDRAQSLAAGSHPRPAAVDPLRRPASSHRARAHPLLRRADDDPRRADQPPRRGQRGVAARVPQELQGRADRHQPRCRARGRDRQPGVLPRCQPPGHRHLQHELEELSAAARRGRGASQEGAGQRREEGDDPAAAGSALRGEGVEGGRSAPDARACREAPLRSGGRASRGPRREAAVPEARPLRQDPAHGLRAVEVVRLAGDLHRRRPRDRPRLQGRRARPERCGQDDAAAHARGC